MSSTAFGPWAWSLAATAAAAILLMLAAFVPAAAKNLYRVVDVVWGLAFALVAAVSFALSAGHGDTSRRVLVTALTVVWGLRLALHIGRRGHGKPEDPRYEQFLAKAKGNRGELSRRWYALTRIFLLQGVLVWFVSLPVQAAEFGSGRGAASTALAVAGTVVWCLGLFFESVGDWQLERFKADPANKGRLMSTGLWRYTRHPNYFGDACVWWGLFLLAADQWVGLATILSPLAMTWLLTRGSGKPLTEAHIIKTRPEYADYAARTSGFIPRRPRGSRHPRRDPG
jgi:steroid 5-alpha reductase family enzyme